MKVLIIDDNAVNRKYVRSVIQQDKLTVITAIDGSTGISLAHKEEPDLILLDIQMPSMDGFECLDRLKKNIAPHIPILAITAFSDAKSRQRFIKRGFNDLIIKPVKPNVLASTVQYWLRNSESKKNSTARNEKADFDEDIKLELLQHIGSNDLIELYKQFEQEVISLTNQMTSLCESEKFNDICSILHTLKGNAGSFGFFKLSELAFRLEEKIKLDKTDNLAEELYDLSEYARQLFVNYKIRTKQ